MTKRAVLYGRVSSDDKAKTGGENLKAQINLCREYATQKGYTVIAELTENDRGASGATFDLPELSRAMDMARNSEFDVLIARELDRLSRDLAKQLIVEQELKRSGVTIEYALYDFPDTPEGRLNKNIRAMLAEYEREKIAQRMKRGRVRKAKAGEVIAHGKAPLGYDLVDDKGVKRLEVNESEAHTIRMIFTWYVEDGLSIGEIRRKLDSMGVPTYLQLRQDVGLHALASRRDETVVNWSRSTVAHILKNETYCGIWQYGKRHGKKKDTIPVVVPAIVSREVWEAAQERKRQNIDLSPRNTKFEYLMRGRLKCGDCGNKMRVTTNTSGGCEYHYYRCTANTYGGVCGITNTQFRSDIVDSMVWEWLCERFQDEAALLKSIEEEQNEREKQLLPRRHELETVKNLIAKNEAGRDRVKKLFYDGHITQDELEKDKQPYESALAGLHQRQAKLEILIKETEFTNEDKRTILDLGRNVRAGILEAQKDFDERLHTIERLNVTGELSVTENGEKVFAISCIVGRDTLFVSSNTQIDAARRTATVPPSPQ